MAIHPHAQCGQDSFAYHVLQHAITGYFIDIGCSDPIQNNNTYALEQLGWRGLSFDKQKHPAWDAARKSPMVEADVYQLDFPAVFKAHSVPPLVEFLSVDVDEASLEALMRLPLGDYRFKVITIEHDRYRFGESLRGPERSLLSGHGYSLICADVTASLGDKLIQFEDWWVDPELVAESITSPLCCQKSRFTDILRLIQ